MVSLYRFVTGGSARCTRRPRTGCRPRTCTRAGRNLMLNIPRNQAHLPSNPGPRDKTSKTGPCKPPNESAVKCAVTHYNGHNVIPAQGTEGILRTRCDAWTAPKSRAAHPSHTRRSRRCGAACRPRPAGIPAASTPGRQGRSVERSREWQLAGRLPFRRRRCHRG